MHEPPLSRFWAWYERHEFLNLVLATGLFLLQLVHLYWLTTDVVFFRLFGQSFFAPTPFWEYLIVAVDYTEIPALIVTSILYINLLRRGGGWTNVAFLIFLNSQWLHIFWITDEFVLSHLRDMPAASMLPHWLAWVAILIDYLELPVIADTVWKVLTSLRDPELRSAIARAGRQYVWRR